MFGRQKPSTPPPPLSNTNTNTYHPSPEDTAAYSPEDAAPRACPPHTTEGKLLARIDGHVVPVLCVLYLLAFLDRVNIANARVFGLEADLGLVGTQFNAALVIFFVPYIVFEVPFNVLLKRFTPRVWLSLCAAAFGAVTVFQGLVGNYGGLLATRFFLGLFECVMFPGCFYILGMWYKRSEAQKRFSLFFSSTSLAGAFGGLLASAIGKMDGIRGYRGWRWLFILEGLLTVVFSVVFWFTLPTFPEQANFLTPSERAFVIARLRADQGRSGAERRITFQDFLSCMTDIKVHLGAFMYLGLIVPAYSYAYFSPTIIQTYRYSPIQTQLHSVPPWAAAFAFAMVVAAVSDATRHRFLFAVGAIGVSVAGFAVLLAVHDDVHTQYAALFLVAMGTYSAMPVVVCWFNLNLGGHHRRAIGTAWQVGFGNIGGIIATFSFVPADAPLYRKGYAICVAFVCLSAVSCVAYARVITRENGKRERAARDVGLSEWEKTDLGDLSPDFRYML